MASVKNKRLDRTRYPAIERAIKSSIKHLIDNNDYGKSMNATADEMFDWWVSNKGYREYFETLRRQMTIKFDEP
jgi:phosphoadenosine phosphosulfate reductase